MDLAASRLASGSRAVQRARTIFLARKDSLPFFVTCMTLGTSVDGYLGRRHSVCCSSSDAHPPQEARDSVDSAGEAMFASTLLQKQHRDGKL